jgi:hypothetical protein
MKKVLFWTFFLGWGFLQNAVGSLYVCLCRGKFIKVHKFSFVFEVECQRNRGSVTLGNFILLSPTQMTEKILAHEYGHVQWSNRLGPGYLIIIGVPSLIHAVVHKCPNYYHFFTEAWAEIQSKKK